MTLLDHMIARPAPLQTDDDGVVRVGGTRVRLETVLTAFSQGASAEEIAIKYPALDLTDVYGVIAYYLWHRLEIDEYLRRRESEIEASKKEDLKRFRNEGVRERLMARRRSFDE